jgi:hypothetical protein
MQVYWRHDSQTVTGDGVCMSDEQQQYGQVQGALPEQSEQSEQSAPPAPPAPPEQSAPPKNAWGDPLSEERQRELLGMLEMQATWNRDAPDADHGPLHVPLDVVGLQISGADVSWLAEQLREEVTRRPTHDAGVSHVWRSSG